MPLSKWTRLWIKLRVKVSMLYSIINVSIKNFSFSPKIRARKRIILRLQEILNALDQANYSEDGNPFYMKANIEYEDSFINNGIKYFVVDLTSKINLVLLQGRVVNGKICVMDRHGNIMNYDQCSIISRNTYNPKKASCQVILNN